MAVIATISTQYDDIDDTLNTLAFAKGARIIKNPVEMNKVITKSTIVDTLYVKLTKLQKDLTALRSSSGLYVTAQDYNSVIENISKKERELNEKLKQITELEDRIKELEVENQLKEKEIEAVNKLFEITNSRAILYQKELLKKRLHVEHINHAVDGIEAAKVSIDQQNQQLRTILERTTSDYKILQNKIHSAEEKMFQNDLLKWNFRETVNNTYTDLLKILQESNKDTFENLTKYGFNVVNTAKLYRVESCEVANKTEDLLSKLQNTLKTKPVDDTKINEWERFNVEIRQCFDFLNIEKQQLEKQIKFLRDRLQQDAKIHKNINAKQLESIELLQNVNNTFDQLFDLQTSALREFSRNMKTIQVNIHSQETFLCNELIQALKSISELNQKDDTIQNNISGISEDIQNLTNDRIETISEDTAILANLSKRINLCTEMVCIITFCIIFFF